MGSKEEGWKTGQKGESLKEQHREKVYKIVEDVAWRTHPVFEKIRMKVLLSQKAVEYMFVQEDGDVMISRRSFYDSLVSVTGMVILERLS